jgi:peptidoglycan/xylan/chitin deacetylase (PgdA/CDA1 family)
MGRLARALGGLVLTTYWLPGAAVVSAPVRSLLGVRNRIEAGHPPLLTFDDGPHARGTPAVLELLRDARLRAVFFLVGEQVERYPGLAAQIAEEGHEIALHCHRHRLLLRLTPRQVHDDLRRAEAAIAGATGRAPRLYRPPYGVLNGAALVLARANRWESLLWSREGHDWQRRATADSIATRVCRSLRGGDVVLLHDADHYSAPGSWRKTVGALPRIIEAVRAIGLRGPGRQV